MGIFADLRDRRLFQIVASYLAAGWIFLEVIDQFVDRGVVPEFVYTIALWGFLCGIPAALLVGWYHGEKGAQKAPRSEIVMLTLIGLVFLGLSSFTVADYREERMALNAAQREAGAELNKIAVLYLEDRSPGAANQHIADGLTEALIDELTTVSTLTVVTRNGSARFRDSDLGLDSIASALAVGTIVAGTFEPDGDEFKIRLRLHEGYTGNEFRSTTIEVDADDVLAAREEVVKEASRLLRSFLGEEVRLRSGGARILNAPAWTLYQRAEKTRKEAERAILDHDMPAAAAKFATADTLLAQAELLAEEWADPIVLRGQIAYRKSRLAHDRGRIAALIDEGLSHAGRALTLAPTHARALELRGTLTYWKLLALGDENPQTRKALRVSAKDDLEESVRIEPTLASAHSTLSHLLYGDDITSAVLAARRAYEADAYLDAAPDVLWRLTNGSYDLENFDQMSQWCAEGAERFAHDYRFSTCQLILMTTHQVEPDVDEAWRLAARVEELSPDPRRAYDRAQALTFVGGVIARAAEQSSDRAAMQDSARNVLARARGEATAQVDPRHELLTIAAHMYTLLGDEAAAIDLLRRHRAANPGASYEHHWWWRGLRGEPAFRQLIADH